MATERPLVIVTRKLPDVVETRLRALFDARLNLEDRPFTRDELIAAVKEVGLKVPLVVRLEGTNVEKGKEIIQNSGLDVIAADDLKDGAEKIVKAVKG